MNNNYFFYGRINGKTHNMLTKIKEILPLKICIIGQVKLIKEMNNLSDLLNCEVYKPLANSNLSKEELISRTKHLISISDKIILFTKNNYIGIDVQNELNYCKQLKKPIYHINIEN